MAPQTECILAKKVFDWCVKSEHTRESFCFALAPDVADKVRSIRCCLDDLKCSTEYLSTDPKTGLSVYRLYRTFTVRIEAVDEGGKVLHTEKVPKGFTHLVRLCAPRERGILGGVRVYTEILDSCGMVENYTRFGRFFFGTVYTDVCIDVEVIGKVKLCVESHGYCVPGECDPVDPDKPVCSPPDPLFPTNRSTRAVGCGDE